MPVHTEAILKKALIKLHAEKVEIEKEIRSVRAALHALGVPSPDLAGRKRRKPMTAAEKRSVSRRIKAYWAKRRKGQQPH